MPCTGTAHFADGSEIDDISGGAVGRSTDAVDERHLMSVTAAVSACLPLAAGALIAHLPTTAMAAALATLNTGSVLARFTAGWLVGVTVVATAGLVVVDTAVVASDSSAWVRWLRIALGVALLILGARKLIERVRHGPAREEPGWVDRARRLDGGRAFATAFLLGSVNPKSVVIALSAVAVIVDASSAVAVQAAALVVFVVVSSVGVAAPALALLVFRDRARRPLNAIVDGFIAHSGLVLAVILLGLGTYMTLNAL
ncbi:MULTISPECIES: GAP family protein [Rhodococcus]|uniref:GAP family protein n=1 Tax=Rhodococcus cerastii TaxID=908616 RepID=A0ABU4CX90_9NOCA|nr:MULTISPECIES: GAP family protein [Rhodococcus]MDV6302076.1 GAP family protein [Rhodococcus cerastii]MDV8057603.1 GAP family protein [Rhodococcus sp. IEGM 1343]